MTSNIGLSGIFSGIDTDTVIKQLIAAESGRLKLYENRKDVWTERQSDLNTLENNLKTLQDTVSKLSDSDDLGSFTTASSDEDIVSAIASSKASEGSHEVVVEQLASAERWVLATGVEYTEDYVGQGNFIYSYNNQESIITTTSTTSLNDLVGLINNDANNPGVTASLLFYNDAYHLVLNGDDAGSDYRISINSSSTEVWKAASELTVNGENASTGTKFVDLDQFGSGSLLGGEVIQITGTDHNGNAIAPVSLNVTNYTKIDQLISEINDAYNGIAVATFENGRIILTDKASGASQLSISLSFNANGSSATLSLPTMAVTSEGGSTIANLSGFTATDFTQTQAARDALIKVDGFPSGTGTNEVQTVSAGQTPTSGTYTLTYEGQTTRPIAYNATATQIQAALEALSTISPGDVTVEGGTSGLADGEVTIKFSSSLGNVSLISIDTGSLGPEGTTGTVEETTQGVQAYISRSSNTIDDVIPGVTLQLHGTTDENGIEVTLTRNTSAIEEKISAMVEAYNKLISFIQEKTAYNQTDKTAGSLMSDSTVTAIRSALNSMLVSRTKGFVNDLDSFLSPGQIGLELDSDGVLSFDSSAFNDAIAENYQDVLALIGAVKTGSSNNNTVKLYGTSSNYTTAGTYNVQVVVSGGAITSAKIKLSDDTTYRDASIGGNIITGNSSFDSNGNPVYSENGLQLSVDLSRDGTYTATVWVKQGFAGAMKDALNNTLKTTNGSVQIDQEYTNDQIEAIDDRIDDEEERLTKMEERLKAKFSAMEKTLTILQSQMSQLGLGSAS
jgi:flagellar hook-associated protein 2